MAQVKLLKLDSNGFPLEMDQTADDITLASYSVTGGGPVLSSSGLDMNNTDVSDIQDLVFNSPSTATINQTAGNLIIDNIVAKERSNLFTTAGEILFPTISDTAGEVDNFRIPVISGPPTATPTNSGEGFMVYDGTNDKLYIWTGSVWDDQSTVSSANHLENNYIAEVNIAARDVVYISSANNVSPAIGTSASEASSVVGFATAAASATNSIIIRSGGLLSGFSGLTAGAVQYLSTSVAGGIQSSAPTGAGNVVLKVGVAKSATELAIDFQYLGRRS